MKYWVVTSGYNCERYIEKCYRSIVNQITDADFDFIMIDDGSIDNTSRIMSSFPVQNKGWVFSNLENMGRCYSIYHYIKLFVVDQARIEKDDVLIMLGMDDELLPGAIERIKYEYDRGAWMTYGNWQDQFGKVNELLYIPLEVAQARSYRRSRWVTTGLQTFKRFLFDAVTPKDLQDAKGNWLTNCTDLALTFPLLEQCPDYKIHKIREPICLYNRNISNSTLNRLGKKHKTEIREYLKTMPIKPLYGKP